MWMLYASVYIIDARKKQATNSINAKEAYRDRSYKSAQKQAAFL